MDSQKAFEWYTKAAEQGDADAQVKIGVKGVAKGTETIVVNSYSRSTRAAPMGNCGKLRTIGRRTALPPEGRGKRREQRACNKQRAASSAPVVSYLS